MELSCKRLSPANNSPKGLHTVEWHLPSGQQVTVYFRKAGEMAGSHFHKGEVASKNPELFLILSGKVVFEFVDKTGNETSFNIDASNGPAQVVIPPYTLHRILPETDIIFIEFMLSPFDPKNTDTYPPRDFPVATNWVNP